MTDWFWKRINLFFLGITIALLFSLVFYASNIEIKDLDLWLHLAVGNYITQFEAIPKRDILSCTIAGHPWINHEWLFQVIVYNIYKLSGFSGIINMQVAIVCLTILILLLLGLSDKNNLLSMFLLLLVFYVYQLRLTHRPDLFSILFFVFYVYTLAFNLEKKSILLFLFIIQILWTNIHGFFILGPILISLSLISESIKRHIKLPFEWNETGKLNETEFRRLKQSFIVVALACLCNPYFIQGALYPLKILFSISGESNIFFQHIRELAPPITLNTLFSLNHYPYFKLLVLISAISFLINYRKIDIGLFLLWFFFLLFALKAVRNVVFFAVGSYFVTLANLENFSLTRFLPPKLNNNLYKGIFFLGLNLIIIFMIINSIGALTLRGYYDFDTYSRKSEFGGVSGRNFPKDAVNFLIANNIRGNFLNDFNSGAYLIGRTFPEIRVFIDGRTEMYGPKFYKEYHKIWTGDNELLDAALKKYKITGAFLKSLYNPVPKDLIRKFYNDKDWALVYFDYDAVIFLKNIALNEQVIKSRKIDLQKWTPPKVDLLKLGVTKTTPFKNINRGYALFNLELYDKAEEEALEALKVSPTSVKAYKLLGNISIKRKEFYKALEYLRQAKLFAPYDINVRYNLAFSFYKLNEYSLAYQQCMIVLNSKPNNDRGLFLLSLIYTKQKLYDKAFLVLKEASNINPKEIEKIDNVGKLFLEQKEIEKAKEVYALLLKRDPDNEKAKEILKNYE